MQWFKYNAFKWIWIFLSKIIKIANTHTAGNAGGLTVAFSFRYTFGKPVKGVVDIRLRPPYLSRSPWSIDNRKKQGLIDEISHSAPVSCQS